MRALVAGIAGPLAVVTQDVQRGRLGSEVASWRRTEAVDGAHVVASVSVVTEVAPALRPAHYWYSRVFPASNLHLHSNSAQSGER